MATKSCTRPSHDKLPSPGWMKSLQCKSRVYDDVVTSTSCRNSYQNLKDIVNVEHSKPNLKPKPKHKPKPEPKSKPKPVRPDPFFSNVRHSYSINSKPNTPLRGKATPLSGNRVRRTLSAPIEKGLDSGLGCIGPVFSSVSELAEGHPSRNVVEIIFDTKWGPKGFTGKVEMVFKIQSPARVSARFEEYRALVKSRAGPGSGARCVTDGNEMMRFHCLSPTSKYHEMYTGLSLSMTMCTYSGSGMAHESGGSGKGRRAMVVCRVIAGRVGKRAGLDDPVAGKDSEFDSVSGENGELLVFDSRAVLPCFLIVYRL